MKLIELDIVEFRGGRRARLAPKSQRALAKFLDLVSAAICALVIAALIDSSIDAALREQGYVALPGWALIACGLALAVNVIGDLLGAIAGFGSLGKLLLGLKIVSIESGEKARWPRALARAVVAPCVTIAIAVACTIPFLWAIAIGWMIFLVFGSWMLWILSLSIQGALLTKDTRQGIHDKAAKTIVISPGHTSRGSWLMSLWR